MFAGIFLVGREPTGVKVTGARALPPASGASAHRPGQQDASQDEYQVPKEEMKRHGASMWFVVAAGDGWTGADRCTALRLALRSSEITK